MTENPVLWRELRVRTRSRQSPAIRWAVALVVGALVLFCYQQAVGYLMRETDAEAGKSAWQVGLYVQVVLIWLLCPSLAANAVTQEKEQQTWDMLIFTLLSPMEILAGKLIARLIPIVAIVAAFLPFMFFCIARGGAGFGEFVTTYLTFGVWILFMTTVSLFMSWAFRRTASAIAMSYLVLFVLLIGTALLEMTLSFGQARMDSPIIWLNPFRIAAAMTDPNDSNGAKVILFSGLTFLGITAFLYWRMVRQFRAFSIE